MICIVGSLLDFGKYAGPPVEYDRSSKRIAKLGRKSGHCVRRYHQDRLVASPSRLHIVRVVESECQNRLYAVKSLKLQSSRL
jgi:hypothetical protein